MVAIVTLQSAFGQSDLFGKMIFLLLFALSMTSWCVIVFSFQKIWKWKKGSKSYAEKILSQPEKIFTLPLEKENPLPFSTLYREIRLKSSEVLEKNRYFSASRSKVFLSANDLNLLESYVQSLIVQKMRKLEKNLFLLPTVITLAPFLGLLGTVWGIFITFSHLSAGGSIAGNSAVLSGLSMALATTVVGLLVAIPAVIGYNVLKNDIREYKRKMVHFAKTLLYHVEMQYRKVD